MTNTKQYDYNTEETIWKQFYMAFNDDNSSHCAYSFEQNNYQTAEDIHYANLDWITEVIGHGCSQEEILLWSADATDLLQEYNQEPDIPLYDIPDELPF